MWKLSILGVICVLYSSSLFAIDLLQAKDKIEKSLGLDKYEYSPRRERLKIAIIDTGFKGYDEKLKGKELPSNLEVIDRYDEAFVAKHADLGDPKYHVPMLRSNPHGFDFFRIVWDMMGKSLEGPHFVFLNGNGPTQFKKAVRYVEVNDFDFVGCATNWESLDNFDKYRGPYNKMVSRAIRNSNKLLWFQAAGNYGGRVYTGPVEIERDAKDREKGGYLRFKVQVDGKETTRESLQIVSHQNTSIKITVSYNSLSDRGTDKDIDIELRDENNRAVRVEEKSDDGKLTFDMGKTKQVFLPADGKLGPNENTYPTELLETELVKNTEGKSYALYLYAKRNNFDANDIVTVSVVPTTEDQYEHPKRGMIDPVELVHYNRKNEMMFPANNSDVITIGVPERYSSVGYGFDEDGKRVNKPTMLFPHSEARFGKDKGRTTSTVDGTSFGTAFALATAAILRAYNPGMGRGVLRTMISRFTTAFPLVNEGTFVEALQGQTIQQLLPGVYQTFLDYTGQVPSELARYSDGRLVASVNDHPARVFGQRVSQRRGVTLPPLFNRFTQQESQRQGGHDFYLLERRFQRNNGEAPPIYAVLGGYRPRAALENGTFYPYPWTQTGESPSNFVELRQGRLGDRDFTPIPMWKTYTPEQLDALVRE